MLSGSRLLRHFFAMAQNDYAQVSTGSSQSRVSSILLGYWMCTTHPLLLFPCPLTDGQRDEQGGLVGAGVTERTGARALLVGCC